ncbi:NYN domain-containing protein [Bradyrhizobium retamae]|uniref:NYN domain-containing protein n=1 Tax=Bradyrhizobium retamae TaxID=1300035 RepID=UPI000A72C7D9|nr:NYN domain-containing protein [Bradyrhizobium retamae]
MRVSGNRQRPPQPQLQTALINRSLCGIACPVRTQFEPPKCLPRPPRFALFIDGANLHGTARTLGFDIDYKRLLEEFRGRGTLLRAFYYTAIIEDQEFSSIRPLVDWLDYNGYTVITKAPRNSSTLPAAASLRAVWLSSLRSMPWSSPAGSTR